MFKRLILFVILGIIWFTLGMVFFDRFIPPFNKIILFVMPWKMIHSAPQNADFVERLSHMQGLLDASHIISSVAFFSMIVSFLMLGMYLSLIYQQKQRKFRENRLLNLKNREIIRRNEFIQFISATIGHEFKNNLGRIKRRIDLLPGLPEKAKELIDNNMHKLFADIDIFKKISDKREAALIKFEKINLKKVIQNLSIQNNDLADVIIEESDPPLIYASLTLIKTVFENIIDNAIKYKKSDEKRAHVSISFSMDKDGKRRYLTLSFRDKGQGMNKLTIDQCFYRRTESQSGWGQGLSFAKYAIGLHAGKIRIGKEYTESCQGTEIIINLPFVEEEIDV